VRLRLHRPAEHPLVGGPAHDDHLEVLVPRPGLAERRRHRHRRPPGGEQLGQHVGEPVAQRHLEPGEEAVGVVDLRGAAALGGERVLGGRERFDRVTLDE
jgi:hypothetical protein